MKNDNCSNWILVKNKNRNKKWQLCVELVASNTRQLYVDAFTYFAVFAAYFIILLNQTITLGGWNNVKHGHSFKKWLMLSYRKKKLKN